MRSASLQHALSGQVTDRIDDLLGHPPTLPPWQSDPRDGRTPERGQHPLSEARAGEEVTHPARHRGGPRRTPPADLPAGAHGTAGRRVYGGRVAEHIGTMTLRGPDGEVILELTAAAKLRALPAGRTRALPTACPSARGSPPALGRPRLPRCGPVTKNRNRRIIIASMYDRVAGWSTWSSAWP